MADRRMFHRSVVESDAFLDMPVGAQALYFHMGMHADDDGFVNGPRQITRMIGTDAQQLQCLIDRGFLLDFDGIVVIKHWRMANTLQNDRIKPLRYPEIAEKIFLKDTRVYTLTKGAKAKNLLQLKKKQLMQNGFQTDSSRNPKGKEQNRKEQKEKERKIIEPNADEADDFPDEPEATAAADTDTSLNYLKGNLGKGVVLLSQVQVAQLVETMGLDSFDHYVAKLADFILHNRAKVKNHYATILKWWDEDRSVNI